MTDPVAESLPWLRNLQKLRNFEGEPAQFWQMCLETLLGIARARAGIISIRTGDDTMPWKSLAMGSDAQESLPLCQQLTQSLPDAAQRCAVRGYAHIPGPAHSVIAVHLVVDVDREKCIALFWLPKLDESEAASRINALLAANDVPAQFRIRRSAADALNNQSKLTGILDIMALLNRQHRFVAAAMTAVNELAGRYDCDRVSIGWLNKGYIRIAAMSHCDHFEKKMDAVRSLELAMEEALDQEAEIVLPALAGAGSITRDHEAYAQAQNIGALATILLRKNDKAVALLSFERIGSAFSAAELRHMRVAVNQMATRLDELKHRDRWFGARWADFVRDKAALFIGHEHTWAKVWSILGAAVLLSVTLVPVRYRVSSPMILRTSDVTYITAPFDGYIDSVGVRAGDVAAEGRRLLSLDKKDLLLEESGLLAEKNRSQREVEKARASGELADMCIAQARLDQVSAKLDITDYKLSQAAIRCPYDGVIIEGDEMEKIGSPVKQGEVLFRVGRIKDIYAEAKVGETEIQNIKGGAGGQIALASRPQEPFSVSVDIIEPSAVIAQKGNVFLVHCRFGRPVPAWFRPGMTGVSKLNGGRKTPLWIVSHRTVDFIRLKLWW